VIDLEIDHELLNEFVLEAKTHISDIEAGLLCMEEGEGDDDTINRIFRAAHSIKGTASFFELDKIVQLAHIIENLFGEFREHRLKVSSDMVDTLLAATDVLKELINSPTSSETYDINDSLTAIKQFLDVVQNPPIGIDKPCDALAAWDLWNELTSADELALATSPPTPASTPAQCDKSSIQMEAGDVITALPVVQRRLRDGQSPEIIMEDSIRVNVGLLNDLLNLAGEMVLWRNQLLRIIQDTDKPASQLEVVAKGIDELTTKLQKKVMKTRMQPIANVFNKFPRIVRDLSRKMDKEIDLVMQGINVELDRSLIESLVDPMTHLVRNALDHGIERPEVRQMGNKPLTGSLILHAYHEGGRVIIDICDDGAGIDPERVKAKAVQKGLIGEKEIAIMREADIINLIMRPGFSTAEKVTDLSGRGVGMDVVKTNIEKLGGKVEIFSDLGTGTTFRLILPLTLAIISALIVVANGQSFAIPQANVRELLLIQPGEASEKLVKMVHGHLVLLLRGNLLPLVGLSELLTAESGFESKRDLEHFVDSDQILRILIIKAGNRPYGLIVDSVYDTEEILVKPLPAMLSSCGLYSGMTVLGDGSIAMILDTEDLRICAGFTAEEDTSQLMQIPVRKSVGEEKQYVLLFKCSGSEMLGLDLAMVSRVEKIDLSQLQKIGSKYYFVFQGQTIRVIRPEHYLAISRKNNKLSKLYVILPKMMKHPIGILAEEIHDAIYTTVSLDNDGVCGTGIVGSALINDTLVILLNIHELFATAAPEYYNRSSDLKRVAGKYDFAGDVEAKRHTILLVEDTPFFLKVVKSYLESEGYDVITAENGREAFDRLGQTTVDAVVSDIEMPVMTGIELVRAIRASESLQHLPVMALTSLTGDVNKEKGLRAGFDVYEYKLDRTRLLDSLRDVLRKRA
jgi:two-component system chemotaxis sensor kinase CheA